MSLNLELTSHTPTGSMVKRSPTKCANDANIPMMTPTALPSLNSDLGLACRKRRRQKCPCAKRTSESTVYSVRHSARCFQSFCDSYIMVWILCWPVHCCSTPASGAWKRVADVNNLFSQNFFHVGLSPETTFAFFDFFDRRRKRLWLGLLITISVPNVFAK